MGSSIVQPYDEYLDELRIRGLDSMSGHRPFSELTKHFSPERRQRIAEMADEMRAELLAADPQMGDPEYVKARADKIFDAWDQGDRVPSGTTNKWR